MPESNNKEPNIYDIDKRVFSLENITQDLSDGMKSLNESTQQMNVTMEKFISSQNMLNDRLTENLEKLTGKQSADKKELFSKINENASIENTHYIEQIKENSKQDLSSAQDKIQDQKDKFSWWDANWKWVISTLVAFIIGIITKFGDKLFQLIAK